MKLGVLNIVQQGEKKKHTLPCFLFFFFIYAMKKPAWRCHGRACTGPALGSGDVFGEVLVSRSIPHVVQLDPVAGWLWLSLSYFSSSSRKASAGPTA